MPKSPSFRFYNYNFVCIFHLPLCPTHFTHPIFLDFTVKRTKCKSPSFCIFFFFFFFCTILLLHLLGPEILPSTQFSNTFNLFTSLRITDQDSHPYRTTDNIVESFWVFFNGDMKRFRTEW